MRFLENWVVLKLTKEKARLFELTAFLALNSGWYKLGRSEYIDDLNYDKSDSLKHVQSEAKVMSPSLSFCDLYYP